MLYQPIVECCTNGAWNSVSVSAHYAIFFISTKKSMRIGPPENIERHVGDGFMANAAFFFGAK